jgi:predicted deacylase
VLFVSSAIHGDEIIGVEIVRRLLRSRSLNRLRGTLLAIPVVNAFGFLNRSRYLPDRRDLNRSFPGRIKGSLAARLAHIFIKEIVEKSAFGIDIHSASIHRSNLPQIRVSPGRPRAMEFARAFGAPLILTSKVRDGSLRSTAESLDLDVLVFEGGEGLRFDEYSVRTGVAGILRVMHHMEMISNKGVPRLRAKPIRSHQSTWVRAPVGGLFRSFRDIGEQVGATEVLGVVSDPFGENEVEVVADEPGLLVGRAILPIVNEGDAIYHVARVSKDSDPETTIDTMTSTLEGHPLFDEDEII